MGHARVFRMTRKGYCLYNNLVPWLYQPNTYKSGVFSSPDTMGQTAEDQKGPWKL